MFKLNNKTEIKDSGEVIKNVNKKTSIPSIINAEMSIKGEIFSDNIVEICGKVDGNIRAEVISIRDGAAVKGEVIAKYVKISGIFSGKITAAIIHITETAVVSANLTYGIISIEEKAKFEGSLAQKSELLEIKQVETSNTQIESSKVSEND